MGYKYILDADGKAVPCDDVLEWAKWFEDEKNRVLAYTKLTGGYIVSTVFIGLSFVGPEYPMFHTTVFGPDDKLIEEHRHGSRGAALFCHDIMVSSVTGRSRG